MEIRELQKHIRTLMQVGEARQVEIVEGSDLLMQLGGVGCLLRYPLTRPGLREPDDMAEPALVG